MRLRPALLALPVTVALVSPATALTFNFNTISGDTLTPGQSAAFTTAAAAWSAVLADPITVNVSIGFTSLGFGILGQTSETRQTFTYAAFRSAYAADAKDASDDLANADLPAALSPAFVTVTRAEAKALSLTPANAAGLDGSIQFSTNYNLATTRAGLNGGAYDLIGIAEHEIGHLLGFVSSVDNTVPSVRTALDLFRYGAAGVPSFAKGEAAYFSIDGGVTSLASFSTANGYQASHWLQGTASGGLPALMNPAISPGRAQDVTALDLTALDVLGYDLVTVPEPGAALVMASALMCLARTRRHAVA